MNDQPLWYSVGRVTEKETCQGFLNKGFRLWDCQGSFDKKIHLFMYMTMWLPLYHYVRMDQESVMLVLVQNSRIIRK